MSVIGEAALSSAERRALGTLSKVSAIVGGAAVFITVGLVFFGIVARFLFNYNLPPSVEYTEYLVPILGFWGAAYTIRQGGHVSADIIFRRFSPCLQQWIILIAYTMGLAYLILLGKELFGLTFTSFKYNYIAFAYPLKTPLGYPQLIMSIGLVLFVLQLLIEIFVKARLLYLNYKHGGFTSGNSR